MRMEGTYESVRTDLAVEAHQMARGTDKSQDIPGVIVQQTQEERILITRMHIKDPAGAQRMNKKMGHYLTLEVPELREKDPDLQRQVTEVLARELKPFLPQRKEDVILVVGLGNEKVTPDSLGPLVVEKLFVTRHLFQHMPEAVQDGFRSVAAVAPGVLGNTGVETSEIVKGIVEHIRPSMVIAIDALASRSLQRVNTTIQVADTGITPGAGVGNRRKGLNEETLGIPVLAIGVPTVVDAVTIAHDTIDLLLQRISKEVPGNACAELFSHFTQQEKKQLIHEILQPLGHNLMVTPKEIDAFVADVASVVAQGLNVALHEGITLEDAAMYFS